MRQTAARLNRVWLTILGVVLLVAGLAGVLISTGLLTPLARQAGLSLNRPSTDQHLFGAAAGSAAGLTWVVVVTAGAASIVALLGLTWLIAQIPRTNGAKPLRLHDDAQTGLTRVGADVVADAVVAQTRALPGVTAAAAVLRGTAGQPDLTLKVTADDRTDLTRLLDQLHRDVASDLADALETRLHRFGVQLEISTTKASTGQITL